jgi:DNA-binding NarL/FixJ family response regulator
MKTKSIVILEDNITTANYLNDMLLTLFPNEKPVSFANISKAKKWLAENEPELALIDIGLPDGSGLNFLQEIKKRNDSTSAIIVTSFSDDENIFKALALGADGYILKESDQSIMLHTLSKIKNGEPPLSPAIALRMMKHFRNDFEDKSVLSPRETETLKLIAQGLTVPEVAHEFGLSPQTVASYVKNIYKKLHVTTRAGATREAIKRGYI